MSNIVNIRGIEGIFERIGSIQEKNLAVLMEDVAKAAAETAGQRRAGRANYIDWLIGGRKGPQPGIY